MLIHYHIIVARDVPYDRSTFQRQVRDILQHKRGWPFRFVEVPLEQAASMIIALKRPVGRGMFRGLSFANIKTNNIHINSYRWTRGSKRSQLGLREYRHYLIYHEVGHLLGFFEHASIRRNRRVPIMHQLTHKGPGTGRPNWFPTPEEVRDSRSKLRERVKRGDFIVFHSNRRKNNKRTRFLQKR